MLVSISKHEKFVKQWRLLAGNSSDSIDALQLRLAGNAYVSYVSGLPTNVIGYVNVTGNSRSVVNGVTVCEADRDEDNDRIQTGLSVWLKPKTTSGYLLTEIFLATPHRVAELKSERSAQVVVEDRVLLKKRKRSEVKIKALHTSTVYVSPPDTAVSLRKLSVSTTDDACVEYNAKSVHLSEKLELEAQKLSSIKFLSTSVSTPQLHLNASASYSTICISAEAVDAPFHDVAGKKHISLPNSATKHGTSGKFLCKRSKLPARKAAKIVDVVARVNFIDEDLLEVDDK
ncbi:hypothetical protein PsorP6_015302 [Peronosclerospora sorghi]|uniref:Uncharacterized protein n=1 Tax=Peronosclerospora sorghi TaxID=230839 RepID=A0ACC0VSK4_9STRA|nr:hypothetical protein PsorP6_015302 [Peronosclerospora sorghi]